MTQSAEFYTADTDPTKSESLSVASSSPEKHSTIRLLRWHEVQQKIGGRSLTAVSRAEKAGKFPIRVRQGNHVGWLEHEINIYLLSLPRGTRVGS